MKGNESGKFCWRGPTLEQVLTALLVFLSSVLVVGLFWEGAEQYVYELLVGEGKKEKLLKLLGIGIGGIFLALQVLQSHRRARAMEAAANAQANATGQQARANENVEQGQRQDRLKNAIEHLGHVSDSVRLGGAYELFHLAQDTKDLRQTVLDILCAHIRHTTSEKGYRDSRPPEPSEEIQSLLTLMFAGNHQVFRGLRIDLQGSWLNGADLTAAHLEGANLAKAHLRSAVLEAARLHEADLSGANLQGADLNHVELYLTLLRFAHLHGCILVGTRFYGADLVSSELCGARFGGTEFQGARLMGTKLQGVSGHIQYGFVKHLRKMIGADSETQLAIFAGGLSGEEVESVCRDLSDDLANRLRQELEPHIDQPRRIGLQEVDDSITRGHPLTGAYSADEAEKWILDQQEAMSEVLDIRYGRTR